MPEFDVVGLGLNATDTLLIVPHLPAYAGQVPFEEEHLSPGGQVASAPVACARLGLRTKHIGAVGDDLCGRIQLESLHEPVDGGDIGVTEAASISASRRKRNMRPGSPAKAAGSTFSATSRFSVESLAR